MPGGENAALLKEMNENLKNHAISREVPEKQMVRKVNGTGGKRKYDGVFPQPYINELEMPNLK